MCRAKVAALKRCKTNQGNSLTTEPILQCNDNDGESKNT